MEKLVYGGLFGLWVVSLFYGLMILRLLERVEALEETVNVLAEIMSVNDPDLVGDEIED